MLSRSDFLKLTKLDVDGFTALKRRELLPVGHAKGRNTYDMADVLLSKLFLGLFSENGINQPKARGIIRLIEKGVLERIGHIPNVLDPAKQLHVGVLYGQIDVGEIPVLGTASEINEIKTRYVITHSVETNLTLTAETIRATASYDGIDIGHF